MHDTPAARSGRQIPRGVIMLWYGAIVDIPAGWVICDGNNGTPNLRDRFVIGAGLAYNPNDIGGSPDHNHTGFSGSSTDTLPAGSAIAAGANFDNTTMGHTHTVTINTKATLPPYHALAYIMKL